MLKTLNLSLVTVPIEDNLKNILGEVIELTIHSLIYI